MNVFKTIQYLTPDNDKLAHFFWGFVYGTVSYLLGIFLLSSHLYAMFLPIVFGLIKEIKDDMVYGGFDFVDLTYTVLPSGIITILIIIFI